MNMTRNGKIARLPKTIREELNHRLEQGGQGGELLNWLNSLPEVQALGAEAFGGRPVSKQSLSEWRRGGYQDWLRRQEALALARQMRAEDKQGSRAEAPPLADQAAGWMTARYLLAVRKLAEQRMAGVLDLQTMRDFLHDVVAVRRGDHRAARLQLERERRDSSGEQGAGSQEQGERRDSSGVL